MFRPLFAAALSIELVKVDATHTSSRRKSQAAPASHPDLAAYSGMKESDFVYET